MDVDTLLKMSESQLDDLFSKSAAGPIPDGAAKGTAIIAPGTTFSPAIAQAISFFTWQGKSFDGPHGVLRNRISVLGLNAIVAEVYKGPSWYDKKECIVLDYSKTSTVAGWIRDAGGLRHIGERAVAVVAKEPIRHAVEDRRTAIGPEPGLLEAAVGILRQLVIEIVGFR